MHMSGFPPPQYCYVLQTCCHFCFKKLMLVILVTNRHLVNFNELTPLNGGGIQLGW